MKTTTILLIGAAAYLGYRYAQKLATASAATPPATVTTAQAVTAATPTMVAVAVVPDEGSEYFEDDGYVDPVTVWGSPWQTLGRHGGHHHGGGGHGGGGHHGGHH